MKYWRKRFYELVDETTGVEALKVNAKGAAILRNCMIATLHEMLEQGVIDEFSHMDVVVYVGHRTGIATIEVQNNLMGFFEELTFPEVVARVDSVHKKIMDNQKGI